MGSMFVLSRSCFNPSNARTRIMDCSSGVKPPCSSSIFDGSNRISEGINDKSPVANAIDGSRGGSSTPGSDNSRSNSSSDSVIGEIEGLKLIVVKH